jgi:zinc protease
MTARSLAFCGVVAATSAALAAQAPTPAQPPPAGAVVAKGKAPVSDRLLQIKLPRAQEAQLANGLRLLLIEDHRAPQVTMQLLIRGAGGYYDPDGQYGLAMFTAATLREGTATRSSVQIAETVERLAATLNSTSGMASEDATIVGGALTEHVDSVLELMADIVLNPTFPEKELAIYKTQMRAQLIQQRTQPAFLARERYNQRMMGNHPDGRIAPTVAALESANRDALAAFHKAHYVPDYAVLAVAGDMSMADLRKKAEARLGGWSKSGIPMPQVADPVALSDPAIHMVARPNSVQTSLVVGAQAIRRTDPDFFGLEVMNKIVGGGPSGRLFRHLREEKGYTYGAYSNLQNSRFRGVWTASTDVRTEVTDAALRDLLDELRQIREVTVPASELADAKRSLIASFALTLESPQALLGNAMTIYRYGLPADYWDRYPERISAITAADVQKLANKYLAPGQIQIIAVGNADTVGPVLGKMGRVDAFDADGKPIKQ